MGPDQIRALETRAWLERASEDLRAAELDLGAAPPLEEDALFHCQQAAEKSFKAFLTWHDVPFRKTHSHEELGEACLRLEKRLKDLVDRAVPLTAYASLFRYPGFIEPPDQEEVQEAREVAWAVFETIGRHLPEKVRLE